MPLLINPNRVQILDPSKSNACANISDRPNVNLTRLDREPGKSKNNDRPINQDSPIHVGQSWVWLWWEEASLFS